MKYLLILGVLFSFSTAQAQIINKEYATVSAKLFYQGNSIIYDSKGLDRSPILNMPTGETGLYYKDTSTKEEFVNTNQVINHMASYGWELKNTIALPYQGGSGNDSKSIIFNSNMYFITLFFEREKQN